MRVSGSKGKWGAYTNVLLPVEKHDQTTVAISTCKELGVPQGSNERGTNPEKKLAVFRVLRVVSVFRARDSDPENRPKGANASHELEKFTKGFLVGGSRTIGRALGL